MTGRFLWFFFLWMGISTPWIQGSVDTSAYAFSEIEDYLVDKAEDELHESDFILILEAIHEESFYCMPEDLVRVYGAFSIGNQFILVGYLTPIWTIDIIDEENISDEEIFDTLISVLEMEPYGDSIYSEKNAFEEKITQVVPYTFLKDLTGHGHDYFIFCDHLGTPFAWKHLDSGQITYTPYSPWGELLANDPAPQRGAPPYAHGNVENVDFDLPEVPGFKGGIPPIGIAGHYYEHSTGLVYMHYRWYHPRLGTFLTPDFRPPNIYDPSTFTEPYAYAAGNPVMYWDMDGLAKKISSTPKDISVEKDKFEDLAEGYYRDGDLHIILLDSDTQMVPFVRNKEELFSETTVAESKKQNFAIAINANAYGVSNLGFADALAGDDPVNPRHTKPEGHVVNNGQIITGIEEPQRFFVSQNAPQSLSSWLLGETKMGSLLSNQTGNVKPPLKPQPPGPLLSKQNNIDFEFGFGNPPTYNNNAVGGTGPLIINDLKYGEGNKYSSEVPVGAPLEGPVPTKSISLR